MDNNSKIFVAGHNGLVGSAIVRNLKSKGYNNIITANRKQLDLTDQCQVDLFFIENKPDYVFLARLSSRFYSRQSFNSNKCN
jgi:GDP-L-fucose synthase